MQNYGRFFQSNFYFSFGFEVILWSYAFVYSLSNVSPQSYMKRRDRRKLLLLQRSGKRPYSWIRSFSIVTRFCILVIKRVLQRYRKTRDRGKLLLLQRSGKRLYGSRLENVSYADTHISLFHSCITSVMHVNNCSSFTNGKRRNKSSKWRQFMLSS